MQQTLRRVGLEDRLHFLDETRSEVLVLLTPQSAKNPLQERASRKRLMGLEPTTFCMASRRSSQLSYSRAEGEYSPGSAPRFEP